MRLISLESIDLPGEMFDGITDSQTVEAEEIERTFPVGGKNAVAILNNAGVEATLEAGGTTQTVSLIRDSIKDWWDYWFAPSRIGRDTVFYFPTQPPGANATLTISYPGGDAKCGLCVTGFARKLAISVYPATVGITDYSRYITDEFGQVYLNPGRFAKRAETKLIIKNENFDIAYREIVKNRGKACIFDHNKYDSEIGTYHTSEDGMQSLVVYGFTEDFTPSVTGPGHSESNHEAQGLT